ncbi:MAG: fatty acid--CoA ligase family protein [Acetobacteraceae bacterium]
MNITAPIRRMARMTPDAPAVIDPGGTTLSYATLDRAIDLMALHATQLGLGAGDIASLTIGPQGQVTSLILLLALARIGVVTTEPGLAATYLRRSFHYGAAGRPGDVRFDATWLADAVSDGTIPPAPMHPGGGALFRILASSGTTGLRKFIPTSHDLTARRITSRFLSQGPAGRTQMVATALAGSGAIISVLTTLWQGSALVIYDPATAIDTIKRFHVDAVTATPAEVHAILEHCPEETVTLPSLREFAIGGSALPAPLRRIVETRLGCSVMVHGGSTEAGRVAFGPAASMETRPFAAGFITPGITIEATDEAGHGLPPGEQGVLRIRSDSNTDGYFDDPAATARAFRDGWFYSGDIGTVWPDGILSISGRVADVIDTGGNKFNPAEIEAVLVRFPGVTEAGVFEVRNEFGLTEVGAALVVSEPLDEAALETFCRRHLAAVPLAAVVEVAALPRNATGKVQRDRLVALAAALETSQGGET